MVARYLGVVCTSLLLVPAHLAFGQCSTNNATSCVCETQGQTNCDLKPDITISWYALENYASGPSEYPQTGAGSNNGRLRVTGSTPNIGHGPLNVRGVDQNGYRWFLCGTDTFNIYDPSSSQQFTCPNNASAQQIILQRVYHKNGNAMSYSEQFAGTMTYHPTHGHNHVDDWATFTLRIEDPNEPHPLNWPIVGTGAKIGFCLMDYYPCTSGSANGHCRTSQEYGGGTNLNSSSQFPNYGLGGGGYNCSPVSQGISVGYTDVYSESLDGMWVNIPPGTCNGDYWIVMEVDPNDNFVEEDETNNWTAIPFTLTQQTPGGGDFAQVTASSETTFCAGGSVQLTASAGTAYLWSTGETTQSINADASGPYSCQVTGICGTDMSDPVTVTVLSASEPVGTDATLSGPGSAALSATGSDVHWYDAEFGGNELGTGNVFNTPVLNNTTSYWAEDRSTLPGVYGYGGLANNSSGGGYFNSDQRLNFDAYEPFILRSVKVYANGPGQRHILCITAAGDLIDELYVNLVAGEQRADLDFNMAAGSGHQITLWDGNGSIRDCFRTNGSAVYPYDLMGLGSITGSTASASGYYYFFYDWEVEKPDMVCSSARTMVTATVNAGVRLAAKVMLDGPYDEGTGLMADDLRQAGLVPLMEPFTGLGFAHMGNGGSEETSSGVLAVSGNDAPVDWVMLELRDPNDPSVILETRSALVQADGDVVDVDGSSPVQFQAVDGSYFVAVRHRNHLGCMTAAAISLTAAPAVLDLSDIATATYGTSARKLVNGKALLWSGNAVLDNEVKYAGLANDRDKVLQDVGGSVPTAVVAGYSSSDVNMDGLIKYAGPQNDRDRILQNIGGSVPTAVQIEQLP
ncbi:MAG: hypothetical protein KDB88_06255 [Flavobacteriales bacterium]|nr:hypothetical protein [Flavobacteriales bacterium]